MYIKKKNAFTLLELMIVVAIIAFLWILTIPNLMKFLAKSKRAEAYINLSSLAMAQKAYFAENGKYTNILSKEGLNWKPEGNFNYSYGFNGSANTNYFMGQLKTPVSNLSSSKITPEGFIICAAGDIDGDGVADVLCINQNNEIKILQDDL